MCQHTKIITNYVSTYVSLLSHIFCNYLCPDFRYFVDTYFICFCVSFFLHIFFNYLCSRGCHPTCHHRLVQLNIRLCGSITLNHLIKAIHCRIPKLMYFKRSFKPELYGCTKGLSCSTPQKQTRRNSPTTFEKRTFSTLYSRPEGR